jgi:hypothetical protein
LLSSNKEARSSPWLVYYRKRKGMKKELVYGCTFNYSIDCINSIQSELVVRMNIV